ncbi:MAG TPA: hypothetical protein PLP34_08975 [Chitinophagaceae bacterium]|nr:hypothetical protein [Chitinophagaceae bacterium]
MICLLVTSCRTGNGSRRIDVSGIHITYQPIRFDRELFQLNHEHPEAGIDSLLRKHPDFGTVYFNELTGFSKGEKQELFIPSLKHFLTYKDYVNLYDTVQKHFPDTRKTDEQLEQLLKHVKYYFPDSKYGTVYYFISGLNFWSAVTVDTLIGVGLDMYLGKQYPFYAAVQIPEYQAAWCEPEYIPVHVARALYQDRFPFQPEGKTLLDMMLEKGKELMYMESVLPDTDARLLLGYSEAQWNWCVANEAMMWNYFATQKLLYATNWQDIMRYVHEGPSTTGMPAEAPGNTGSWIGWMIMKQYALAHPEIPLIELLGQKTDAQNLIREIHYKPK